MIGFDATTTLQEEHLAAPIGRWARALEHHIPDIGLSVVRKKRAVPQIVPLLRTAARDPNRDRIPLVARTNRIPANSRVMPIAS